MKITKFQRFRQGTAIFILSILLILGSLLTAVAEERFSSSGPLPTSPILRTATTLPISPSSSKNEAVSYWGPQPSSTSLPRILP